MGSAARQPSQVLLEVVLGASHQGQQVEGRDAGHVASADLQHAYQTLRHGGPQAFHLRERAEDGVRQHLCGSPAPLTQSSHTGSLRTAGG